MITRLKSTRIITPDGVRDGYLYFSEEGIIAVTGERDPQLSFDSECDVGDLYVSPGFIDIHTHGAMDVDYCSAESVDDINRALAFQLSHGATTVLPTVTSSTPADTAAALRLLSEAIRQGCAANVPGVHLEGPFFSPKQCGAQNPELITPPRVEIYEPLLREFGDIIVRWDYAPERDEGCEFCRALVNNSVLPSAGHTDAEYEDMLAAHECGMKLVTHLYSCTSTITRRGGFRHLGVTECAYLFDDLYAEIIADGKHLPPELLRLIFKLKRHDRLILVTDSLRVAGVNATESVVGGVPCIIEDGVCKLRDRTAFAGSVATADRLVRVVTADAGLEVDDAVRMISENPARLFGLNTGRLESGRDADVVVFDDEINIKQVYLRGVRAF